MSYHGTSGTSSNNTNQTAARQSTPQVLPDTNVVNQIAPPGFHYMPDGTLMSNEDHARLMIGESLKTITAFNLDLSDISAKGERRAFTILGGVEAKFRLEIKDNTTGYYYNFVTGVFQAASASLEETIGSKAYNGIILFPSVTGSDDQYNVFLHAFPGSKHNVYKEARFGDGSIDINNSIGSNSLIMKKVIYQYTALTLTLQGYSIGSALAGTFGTDTISINKGKSSKTSFSFATTAAATAAYRILKQPKSSDVLSFVSPVIGSAPIQLPGENPYPATTATGKINVAVDNSTTVTVDALSVAPKVGDKFIITNGPNSTSPQIVTAVGEGNITSSIAITAANDKNIAFSNQMNYSWPINNFANIIKKGMVVEAATSVTAGTSINSYQEITIAQQGTENEKYIIKNNKEPISTLGKKPTIVNGLVTVQEGQIVFNKQQVLTLAGDTLNIGGYGETQIFKLYGWDVRFTNLKISLVPPTTTTTEATSAHATIAVADKEGVINNVSRVGGIGIDPSVQNPLITSGGSADGAGDWVMGAVQTLENGATLIIENTSRVANVTGDIEIIKAGTANQTLRFDMGRLLSTSA